MRRRRPIRRRAQRRETGWIECIIPDCWESLRPFWCTQTETAWEEATDYWTLVAPTDVRAVGRTITIARMVGEIQLGAAMNWASDVEGWSAIHIDCGIFISDVDETDGIMARAPGKNIEDQRSGDWLWRNSWSMMVPWDFTRGNVRWSYAETNQYSPSAHVDIRVKRKLQEREGLYLATLATWETVSGQGYYPQNVGAKLRGNLRALALEP